MKLYINYIFILPFLSTGLTGTAALMVQVSTVQSTVHRSATAWSDIPPASPAQAVIDSFAIGGNRRHIYGLFAAKQTFTLSSLTDNLMDANIIPESTTNTSL